jgi:hypothetical protein
MPNSLKAKQFEIFIGLPVYDNKVQFSSSALHLDRS